MQWLLRVASSLVFLAIVRERYVLAEQVLDGGLYHIRQHGSREWNEFPEEATHSFLEIDFESSANPQVATLRLRQQDVKQTWQVLVNEHRVGQLLQDENDLVVYFSVPPGTLVNGRNVVRVQCVGGERTPADDIRVGQMVFDDRPLSEVLSAATIEVRVVDDETEQLLPARITVMHVDGALQTTAATSNGQLAVRPGTIYTASGSARFGVPAGTYTLLAGRGFEYSLARTEITVAAGETWTGTLTIRREVPTEGYVACDTHVHTLTHSGHGDATVQERMVTLAAEGIELPVAADHNVHVQHDPFARELGVRQYFTPVVGNEVTTGVGHFNVFPVPSDAPVPNAELSDWPSLFAEIRATTEAPVIILNHARDLHRGVRPFGSKRYHALVAEPLNGWPIGFNCMEVVNSSATQNDPMRLFHDWMALLNRGHRVTPIGASDSHDVLRHFVGQGRTYIRCDDSDVSNIDLSEIVNSLVAGRVRVSYGLLVELTVGDQTSGDIVRLKDASFADKDQIDVHVRVLGPHWIQAEQVGLYVNGQLAHEVAIAEGAAEDLPMGVKWAGSVSIEKPAHDVHLVAIARGPGITDGYWRMAKPYQPKSPLWRPEAIGCSGALWLDADGDGQPTPAHTYAQRVYEHSRGNLADMLQQLADYHPSVTHHAVHAYRRAGGSLESADAQQALRSSAPSVRDAVADYTQSVHALERAQFGPE